MPNKESPYKRKSARVRQQELIEAGITCLGNGGMSGFTIDQICKTAGVSRGLINHHFKTKEELLIRIYTDMTEHLVDDRIWPSAKQKLKTIIDISFDEGSFNRSNLRAWLSIWGQVPNNPVLSKLHRDRYRFYSLHIKNALQQEFKSRNSDFNTDSVARQLIALIDGLWLEYCLNAEGYSLADAKADCYQFLEGYGIRV